MSSLTRSSSGRGGPDERVITGWHVLFAVLAFFGLVIAVNAAFIFVALETNTGVVANEPYRKGLRYNERIEFDREQAALGWKHALSLSPDTRKLIVRIADKDGNPVLGLSVAATLGRPASGQEDQSLAFTEAEPGSYETAIKPLNEGAYIATLELGRNNGERTEALYRAKERLWVKP